MKTTTALGRVVAFLVGALKIFEITLLDRVFKIFESRDAALAFLEAGGPSPAG